MFQKVRDQRATYKGGEWKWGRNIAILLDQKKIWKQNSEKKTHDIAPIKIEMKNKELKFDESKDKDKEDRWSNKKIIKTGFWAAHASQVQSGRVSYLWRSVPSWERFIKAQRCMHDKHRRWTLQMWILWQKVEELNDHMKANHVQDIFACESEVCDEKLSTYEALDDYIKTNHVHI